MQLVDVVVGGQYGSEAKGHVTAQLVAAAAVTRDRNRDGREIINIRVAGPNAGHTAYDVNGNKFAFRTLPIGAVIDHRTLLYIAPGSEVELAVLREEIELAETHGHPVRGRLFISKQATLLEDKHKTDETNMELAGRIGSTGKGIGAARADRILRAAKTLGQWWEETGHKDANWAVPAEQWCDNPVTKLWTWVEPEDLYAQDCFAPNEPTQHIIIEGTQGYGLSLRASGNYPQTTSSDCRAVDFLAMAGVDPTRAGVKVQNWVVARVYPIRVAGNSGPMKNETTWEELGLEPEKTTVTKKTRRVGAWDTDLLRAAVQANGGSRANVVITMLDQVVPELRDINEDEVDQMSNEQRRELFAGARAWIEENANRDTIGAHVVAFTYSPTAMRAYVGGQVDAAMAAIMEMAAELITEPEPEPEPEEPDTANTEIELRNWWMDKAANDIDSMVNKMFEYGGATRATDLTVVGRAMVDAGVRGVGVEDEAQLQELGIYFYLQGKIARWAAAIGEGRPVSDDTIHDIVIYATMVQRIRATGGWPV